MVPPAVVALADGVPLTPVWRNQLGGLTWQLGEGPQRRFVKWAPAGSGLTLSGTRDRAKRAGKCLGQKIGLRTIRPYAMNAMRRPSTPLKRMDVISPYFVRHQGEQAVEIAGVDCINPG